MVPGWMVAPTFFRIPRRVLIRRARQRTSSERKVRTPQGRMPVEAARPRPGGAFQGALTDSATENKPPRGQPRGQGEKVG